VTAASTSSAPGAVGDLGPLPGLRHLGPGSLGRGTLRPFGGEVDDLGRDLPGLPVQPLPLGIAGLEVAIEIAALAAFASGPASAWVC
jgi:hypothetical protein